MSCNVSAKPVYINVLDFLMLFCYTGDEECLLFYIPWNFKSCKTGHPLMVNALFTPGPAQCVLVKKKRRRKYEIILLYSWHRSSIDQG